MTTRKGFNNVLSFIPSVVAAPDDAATARHRRDHQGEANALVGLGNAYWGLRELQQARAIGEQINDSQIILITSAALAELDPATG